MTKEQIAELRRLEQEATPAPWLWEEGFRQIVALVHDPDGRDGEDWDEKAERFRAKRIVQTDGGCYGPRENDRALIVTTRNTLARLLDEREALLEALKAAADKLLWANSNLMHSWAQERPCDHEAAVEANEGETAARAAIAKAEAE